MRKIRWPDKDHVDAVDLDDFGQLLDGLESFHLQDNQRFLVGLLNVFAERDGLRVVRRAHARQSSDASGLVFYRLHGALGVLCRVDPGYLCSLGAGVEIAQDDRLQVGGDANNRRDATQLGGPHHVLAIARLEGPVLCVQDKEIPPLETEQLNQAGVGVANEAAENSFTGFEFRFG